MQARVGLRLFAQGRIARAPTTAPKRGALLFASFSKTKRNLLITVSCVSFLLVLPCALRAQNWNSNLEGFVLDPTRAAIPDARVELHNTATAQRRETRTNSEGFYSFPMIPVGAYEL